MLFGIYSKKLKTYVYAKTCTRVFIAALFVISKTQEQPRHSSVGKEINKLWCIQTLDDYSLIFYVLFYFIYWLINKFQVYNSIIDFFRCYQVMKRRGGKLDAYY